MCVIEGCDRPALAKKSKNGLCRVCYDYEYRWGKRTPTERAARLRTITVWQIRLERLSPPGYFLRTSGAKKKLRSAVHVH